MKNNHTYGAIVLPTLLLLSTIVLLISLTLSFYATTGARFAQKITRSSEALSAAESGINEEIRSILVILQDLPSFTYPETVMVSLRQSLLNIQSASLTIPYQDWHEASADISMCFNLSFGGIIDPKDTCGGGVGLDKIRIISIGASGNFYREIEEFLLFDPFTYQLTVDSVAEVPYANTALSDSNLIAYWEFNEGYGNIAYDSSGHGNNASSLTFPQWIPYYDENCDMITFDTQEPLLGFIPQAIASTPTPSPGGSENTALYFDNNYARVTDPSDFDTSAGDITVSAWVFTPGGNGVNETIISRGDAGGAWNLELNQNDEGGFNSLTWSSGGAFPGLYSDTLSLSGNTWHHIVATQSGTTATLYADGQEVVSGITLPIGSSGDINIGTLGGGFGGFLHAYMDEVRVYNIALTTDQILWIYSNSPAPTNYPLCA